MNEFQNTMLIESTLKRSHTSIVWDSIDMKGLIIGAESRFVVSWRGGQWESGLSTNEQKEYLPGDGNIFKLDHFDDCTNLQIY